ncbi:uncharacterized protein HD556DRAFT_1404087 [Suillus plorans]|uniref:Uncharacterized protein n=1 Tax=Suillus plorans TaxID=116603 RepID=A0A9P7AFN8_9AGAM|nr:uncharacterized protein HD556DRAFT_1404087 [Suillus plorans]KAG1788351.1 hypothetical protein HD556DRAFT_1404087 [Suillus plorans]
MAFLQQYICTAYLCYFGNPLAARLYLSVRVFFGLVPTRPCAFPFIQTCLHQPVLIFFGSYLLLLVADYLQSLGYYSGLNIHVFEMYFHQSNSSSH